MSANAFPLTHILSAARAIMLSIPRRRCGSYEAGAVLWERTAYDGPVADGRHRIQGALMVGADVVGQMRQDACRADLFHGSERSGDGEGSQENEQQSRGARWRSHGHSLPSG